MEEEVDYDEYEDEEKPSSIDAGATNFRQSSDHKCILHTLHNTLSEVAMGSPSA